MKNLTIQELTPLQNLINETSLSKLESFLINTNLSKDERVKLIDIIKSISPIQENYLDHLG
jgi:hypothetical protein